MCRECLLASMHQTKLGQCCPVCRQPVNQDDILTMPSKSRYAASRASLCCLCLTFSHSAWLLPTACLHLRPHHKKSFFIHTCCCLILCDCFSTILTARFIPITISSFSSRRNSSIHLQLPRVPHLALFGRASERSND